MKTFLVAIHNEQAAPAGQSDPAAEFVRLWLEALPPERRAIVRRDDRLMACALLHANYLHSRTGAELLQSMHRGVGGSYSNGRVLVCGYRLPPEYRPDANNVESCARDAGGPQAALDGLLASPAHRPHLLGEVGFSDRVVWGIGQAGDDYVVLICPEEAA